ncbi:flagellar FLiS export co-chaperone [Helicobacter mesocricetorum]|uniref:flagellar FLiS export co-chaperone n=1 Tax=Helicobacter mesocricetorum TaxID=87012 RepID=UPI000CF02F16|nr:flagellar FLiS export co-chaperone [Helicobacter mesocricetorum]
MFSSVNPYGLGNIQTRHTAPTATKQDQITEKPQSQERQELPAISNQVLEIRKFSDGIKGANEIIGAMQIADITLNALGSQVKTLGEIDSKNINLLDTTAKNAQFKGETLFGKELTLNLAGENVSLSLPLPSQLLNENSSFIQALSNKHDEISQKLGQVSNLIEKASLPFNNKTTKNFDFENFDADTFKGLFS